MFLPAFAAITFFSSWAFSQSSPSFWEENIAPNIGLGFATFMASLTFVVVLGYILAVGFHSLLGSASHSQRFMSESMLPTMNIGLFNRFTATMVCFTSCKLPWRITPNLYSAVTSAATLGAVFWHGMERFTETCSCSFQHHSFYSHLGSTSPHAARLSTWLNRRVCSQPTFLRFILQRSTWSLTI